jgi:DNA-binding winged helix-turn-helix (wHTH) protein
MVNPRITLVDRVVDLRRRAVLQGGRSDGRLSPREAELLEYLVGRAPEAVSRDALLEAVWGADSDCDARTVTVTLARLRAKIEADPSAPVHLVTDATGYRFVPASPPVDLARTTPPAPWATPPPAPPREATPFVDRPEAATARALLARERIVALVGPPGSGKSRLAEELAATIAGRAVLSCPLESSRDVDEIEQRIAPLLGAGRPTLIVLDDAEHLAAALAAPLKRWVATDPHVVWLVTSREPMRIAGEAIVPVAGLATPGSDDPAAAAASPAVALLVERLRAVRGAFAPSEVDLAQLGTLARRLDGLPLALELAAGRGRLLSPAALLRRCEDRPFELLTSDRRDLPPRRSSMRAALAATWDRLAPWERAAVHIWARELPPTAALDVVEAAFAAIPGAPPALDVVQALLDRGLLLHAPGADGEPRLSLPWLVACYVRLAP